MSLEELRKEANQSRESGPIVPGQRLKVPVAPDPVSTASEPVRHPPQDPELEAMFEELSTAEALTPRLVKAVAWLESGWQQHAVSPAGAIGVMQLTPVTASGWKQSVFGLQLNEDVSVNDNIKMGTRYLRHPDGRNRGR